MPDRDLIGEAMLATLKTVAAPLDSEISKEDVRSRLEEIFHDLRSALAAEREAAKERERMLREELRRGVVVDRPRRGGECALCDGHWGVGAREVHHDGCLAALPDGDEDA